MITKLKNIFQSQFVRSVSVLAGATAIGQAVMLLALPFLTRLYTPEEFGLQGIIIALLGILGSVASFRYQVAIPLPKTDIMAVNLMAVAFIAVMFTTMMTVIAIVFLGEHFAMAIETPEVLNYLWFLPAGMLVIGIYNVLLFWSTRKKAFKRIARTRIEQAIGGAGTQLGMGVAGFGAGGLLTGQLISQGAGFLGLGRRVIKKDGHLFKKISVKRMVIAAIAYQRYPKFSTFEALFNSAASQLPLLIIVGFVGSVELGLLMLAMRIMQAPMSLVGAAVSQVYYTHAVEAHRQDELAGLTAKVMGGLAKTGVGPLLFAGAVAPDLFGLIFGEAWQRAGVLLAWMTPWFALQFLSSPVSMALHVTSQQRLALGLQIFGLVLRVTTVAVAGVLMLDGVSELYAVSGAVFYLIYLIVVSIVVGISALDLFRQFWASLPFILAWILVAILVKLLLYLY